MFYVQYNTDGVIIATVEANSPPSVVNQLEFSEYVGTQNKKVDLGTMTLVDVPPVIIQEGDQ